MESGKLNRRLQIQSMTVTRDSFGAAIETWTTGSTVWGSIDPLSGTETFASEQIITQSTHVVSIRYRGDVTTEERLVYGGWVYDIRYVAEVGRGEESRLLVRWTGEQVTAATADDPFLTFGDDPFVTFADDPIVTF